MTVSLDVVGCLDAVRFHPATGNDSRIGAAKSPRCRYCWPWPCEVATGQACSSTAIAGGLEWDQRSA